MAKAKSASGQKIRTVPGPIRTGIGTADLRRKHSAHPPTFQTWWRPSWGGEREA